MSDASRHTSERLRKVTIRDIALRSGVSTATVSLALHADPRIKLSTRERIQAVAAELGYDPHAHEAARRLAYHRHGSRYLNKLIALLFREDFLEVNYYISLFHGVTTTLMREGFGLLTIGLPWDIDYCPNHPYQPPSTLMRGDADALILYKWDTGIEAVLASILNESSHRPPPVVMMTNRHPSASNVLTDDRQGAYHAAQHLLALGHRHLLQLVFHLPVVSMDSRLAGIRQALQEYGLDPTRYLHQLTYERGWLDPFRIPKESLSQPPHPSEELGTGETLIPYLRAHPEITAMLGVNDSTAIHAWYALRRAGWRIPEDISLIGFDDNDALLNDDGVNILTSVRLPLCEVGMTAARLAVQRVTGVLEEDTTVILPTEFIARASTAPPRSQRRRSP